MPRQPREHALIWQLADAKNRFSEVVRRALTEGPQKVTRRQDAVIILSEAEYQRLTGSAPNLVDYLMEGPSFEDVPIERDSSPARPVHGLSD
ncbi:MAG: type II toxin-antitoxin system prevent-host-death family antitoxin [Pseudomonadota bacterium]